MDKAHVLIRFSNLSNEQREKLFEAERLLLEIGVHFDVGTGCEGRDWEWDWSLKGPAAVYFKRLAKDYVKPSSKSSAIEPQQADGVGII